MLRILLSVATDYPIELCLRTKVEKEPELEIARLEVVVELSGRGFMEVRSRLRFYDKFFVYNQIKSLAS